MLATVTAKQKPEQPLELGTRVSDAFTILATVLGQKDSSPFCRVCCVLKTVLLRLGFPLFFKLV